MPTTLKHSINAQRALLHDLLGNALSGYASEIAPLIDSQKQLDAHLSALFAGIQYCKYVYVLDHKGVQVSATVNRYGSDEEAVGRDRADRPYMDHISDTRIDFNLSEAYISRNKKRPSLTAIQTIRDAAGRCVGFLGVDFDLRDLPHSEVIYEEPSQWQQIKGDPSIRKGLFLQERVESLMDTQIDDILSVHEALMQDQGVHHIQIHFSSSRSTIWHIDDPYVYRLLTINELADSSICLAFPRRPYFERAIVPPADIGKVLKQFKALRFADETIYLRSGSLNIVNGKVGLNFSCDGTHYLSWDAFLANGLKFWFGGHAFPQAVASAPQLDYAKLDALIDHIAAEGCIHVNKLIYAVEKEEPSERLAGFSSAEIDYVYRELKSVMDVYEGGVCNL